MGEHKMDYYLITVLCNFCLLLVIRRLASVKIELSQIFFRYYGFWELYLQMSFSILQC